MHIDDLRPPQANRPEISHLRGQGVHSLLQQDLRAAGIQIDRPDVVEEETNMETEAESKDAMFEMEEMMNEEQITMETVTRDEKDDDDGNVRNDIGVMDVQNIENSRRERIYRI